MEFKWNGKPQKGLVYNSEENPQGVSVIHTDKTEPDSRFHYCKTDYENFTDMREIGHIDSVPCWPVDFDAAHKAAKAYFSSFTPDPDKSYAENQAVWVKFHKIKRGSKVKVLREFVANEGGSSCASWDHFDLKRGFMGTVCTVRVIEKRHIRLVSRNASGRIFNFPYFALEPVK